MPQARTTIVHDLARRYHDRLLHTRELMHLDPVEHRAVARDQRPHPKRIEHIERRDDTARVAVLEDVGIAVQQLRGEPLLHELNPSLISVWLGEYRQPRCVALGLGPNAVVVFFDELEPEL